MFTLYLISDRKLFSPEHFWRRLEQALRAGLPAFQLREKDLCDRDLYAMACRARELTRRYGCKLLINGRFDIAKAVGADGVHLPEDSLPIHAVRQALGARALIAKSTHSLSSARKAQREGANFITFGPVFATASKKTYGAPLDLAALRDVCSNVRIPVFALGGITLGNTSTALAQGAQGIALISGIWSAKKVGAATTAFLKL